MVKLHITFPEPIDQIHGETLWATPLKNGNYRLENNPIYEAYRYRDIVKADLEDGMLELRSLVMRALE